MQKKLELIFASVTLIAVAALLFNWYRGYRFDSNPLSPEIVARIESKERDVVALIRRHYGIDFDVPIVISEKINSRLYGLAAYEGRDKITIVLNKKRMKESLDYILDDVLPHEYAHALMFRLGYFSGDDGHSEQWQEICRKLEGARCDRFVNHQDIIMGKIAF